jgi:signal transduction histidine kinase
VLDPVQVACPGHIGTKAVFRFLGSGPRAAALLLLAGALALLTIPNSPENLLDLHRIDSDAHLRLDRQLVPAARLVENALSYVRSLGIVTEIDERLRIWVDPARFEQIIVNLVGNAAKYGLPPIVVCLSAGDTVDRLEVRDHGPGVPDTRRPTLFSPFAAAGTDSVGPGLWIVRQLAEAHGGRAGAEARTPGVATVVTFRAPAAGDRC